MIRQLGQLFHLELTRYQGVGADVGHALGQLGGAAVHVNQRDVRRLRLLGDLGGGGGVLWQDNEGVDAGSDEVFDLVELDLDLLLGGGDAHLGAGGLGPLLDGVGHILEELVQQREGSADLHLLAVFWFDDLGGGVVLRCDGRRLAVLTNGARQRVAGHAAPAQRKHRAERENGEFRYSLHHFSLPRVGVPNRTWKSPPCDELILSQRAWNVNTNDRVPKCETIQPIQGSLVGQIAVAVDLLQVHAGPQNPGGSVADPVFPDELVQ